MESPQPQASDQASKPKNNPPTTLEEYMKMERVTEWPERITSEGPLTIGDNEKLFKNPDEVENILREAAPFEMNELDSLEQILQDTEKLLFKYAEQIVTDNTKLVLVDDQFMVVPKGKNVIDIDKHLEGRTKKKKTLVESIAEQKKKSIEHCTFPGFREGELTELPAQMETPQILNQVTKAQNFRSGFKKFWKKIFLSEASVAVTQDSFWWFFMHFYEKNRHAEMDKLYDRISDSFVALLLSVNPEIKDKFFLVYSDCLAQSIFTAMWECFPESQRLFDAKFKEELIVNVWEWVSGLIPPPETWKRWNLRYLGRMANKGTGDDKGASNITSVVNLSGQVENNLDFDGFMRILQRLEMDALHDQTSRENTKVTIASSVSVAESRNAIMPAAPTIIEEPESHQIGPGPTLQRIAFNTLGKSPLVAHFLYKRELQDLETPMKRLTRTQVTSLPPKAPTYREVIKDTLQKTETLSRQYEKACIQTAQELHNIEMKKRKTTQDIMKLQKDLSNARNSLERKVMSEKILEMRDRDSSMLGPGQDLTRGVNEDSSGED